jgi:hypothetical protein
MAASKIEEECPVVKRARELTFGGELRGRKDVFQVCLPVFFDLQAYASKRNGNNAKVADKFVCVFVGTRTQSTSYVSGPFTWFWL